MKRLLTFASLLAIACARANGTVLGGFEYLPIDGPSAINKQVSSQVDHFVLTLGTAKGGGGGWWYNQTYQHDPTVDLASDMLAAMTNFFGTNIDASLSGTTANFYFQIWHGNRVQLGTSYRNTAGIQTSFVVQYDTQGNLIAPYHDLLYSTNVHSTASWTLSGWVPIPKADVGVERVDYVLKYTGAPDQVIQMDHNGAGCWTITPLTDGSLYLIIGYVFVTGPISNSVTASQVILWYNVAGGVYDSFDSVTGMKTDSTLVQLAKTANGVSITGFPGKTVTVETSTYLTTWSPAGTVTLGTNGTAAITAAMTSPTRFYRARVGAP